MNNAVYDETMETLRNRIDVKPYKQRKRPLKLDIKTKLYVTKNI